MRILLDACVMSATFDPLNQEHSQFRPLLNWLRTCPTAKLVSGGSKYSAELACFRKEKYIGLLAELQKAGKRVVLIDQVVDTEARRIKERFPQANFNDEHLAAIIAIGKCQLLATNDKLAATYIRKGAVLPPGTQKPRIYMRATHANLLKQ